MKTVFVDAAYWIAIFRPGDPWAETARRARQRLGPIRLLTVDDVLVEFLAAVSAGGPALRLQAVRFIRLLLERPDVEVLAQSRRSFLDGLDMYQQRRDKNYSLTDCIAMNAMRAASITEVLTSDRHFEQEGFRVLMK